MMAQMNTRAVIVDFGRRVRAYRLAARISQPELGRRARVGYKFIGQIERGVSNPSLETMALVADALGCTLTDLLQPEKSSAYVSLRADDVRRAQEALLVMASVLAPRKRPKRAN